MAPAYARSCPLFAAWLGVLALVYPWSAGANGRYPRAQRLIEDPRDPAHLVLAATYGLLTTRDRGKSWYHICEASFSGLEGYVGDPLFDFASDGTMLVGVQAWLNRSTDEGCSWVTTIGESGTVQIVDFTLSKAEPGRVLSLRSATEDGSIVVRLFESKDDGRTFEPAGTPLPIYTAFTLDVAPSDPTRIYATGVSRDNAGYLLSSHDGGRTWESRAIPDTSFDAVPYLATIHPRDPNKLFVRVDGRLFSDVDGRYHANDAVLFSEDGGNVWTEIHRAEAKVLGFALSPDGSELLIGYGDDEVFEVDEAAMGAYASSTERFAFTRRLEGSITCLSWTDKGIYVCTPQSKAGRELSFAPRSSFGPTGVDLEPLLRLPEVRGPLACCDAKVPGVCRGFWPTACLTFQACEDASLPNPCGRDGGEDDGGGVSTDAAVPTPDAGTPSVSPGSCGCRMGALHRRGDVPPWWPAYGSALALVRARSMKTRRRKRKGDAPPAS